MYDINEDLWELEQLSSYDNTALYTGVCPWWPDCEY